MMDSRKILLASTIALALALATTFGILYTSPNTAAKIFNLPTPESPTSPKAAEAETTTIQLPYSLQPVESSENTLTVSGLGVISVKPDRAKIQMSIITEASIAKDAAALNADAFSKFLQTLEQAGISRDKVATTQYSIYPVYYYPPQGQPILTGYKAEYSYTVTIIAEEMSELGRKAGEVIDLAVGAGVNQVSGIYFTVSDEAFKALQDKALIEALKDADGRANLIANTLGLKILNVKSISYGAYYPISYPAPSKGAVETATTELIPSQFQVSASVQIVYLIGQA